MKCGRVTGSIPVSPTKSRYIPGFFIMYFTYILYSQKLDKFYIGSTDNLDRRLMEHNRGKGNYTKNGVPWELIFREVYETRRAAVQREKYIKGRKSRAYIEDLIKETDSEHPDL